MHFFHFGKKRAQNVSPEEQQRREQLSKTQKIVLTRNELNRDRMNLAQNESFQKLAAGYSKQIKFMRVCVEKSKNLRPAQLKVLQKRFRTLEGKMDIFLNIENGFLLTKTFEEASRVRMSIGAKLSDKLIREVQDMEQKGLFPKGFTHDTFRRFDNNGQPRTDI